MCGQKETWVCGQKETADLEDGAVEEHSGLGFGIGVVSKEVDIAVGAQAPDNRSSGRRIDSLALGGDRDPAVVADTDAGALAPDKGPPWTGGCRAEDGALFGQGLVAGGLWGSAEFAVDFVGVGVGHQLVQELVGLRELEDLIGGQERRQPFLPVVVTAFDLAFGLGSGSVTEVHAVEVESRAQLGEGVGIVGVEEGVVVHVESQGQAVGLEGAGQEVEVGQQGFFVVEASAGIEAGGIVQEVQEDLLVLGVGQPGVGAGVILPEGTPVTGLPAFDWFGRLLVASVGSQLVLDGPTADTGAVGQELETTVEFAGTGAVGGRGIRGEERGEQGVYFHGPVRMMIATGTGWNPGVALSVGAGAEILSIELVEAAAREAQFRSGARGVELASTEVGQEVTNEGGGTTMN